MRRAIPVIAVAAPLLAWSWLRLEDGGGTGEAAFVIALAVVPAFVPGRLLRAAAVAVALLVAGALAFDLGLAWSLPWRVLARFGGGFLEFYDVQLPFDPATHPRMHGVLLLAAFAFTLAVALAAVGSRPGLAAAALVVGVGWPGTLLPGHDLLRGALLLATVLAAATLLRRGPLRGVPAALAAGALVVLIAVAGSASPALAKRAFLNWQEWDPYTKPAKPVDVSYVWDSSYRGLSFRGKPTTVLRVKANAKPHYWRVSVLRTVVGGQWVEELSPVFGAFSPLGEEGLVPRREVAADRWERQQVTVEALREHRLAGASSPVRFETDESIGDVMYDPAGVAYATKPLDRGDSYDVWSYSPSPSAAQLARSQAAYPRQIVTDREYREVEPRVYPKLFGAPGRDAHVRYLIDQYELQPYSRLYALAQHVAGGARSPYAAAVALERWFRVAGGFTYDQHPPQPAAGVPALAAFVGGSKRGYCQHFAGAMTLMLRYLGIPSRVAVGFASGEYDKKDGEWVVSDREAHMWVEVWFAGWGWLPFDPTPGRAGLPGAYSTSSRSFDRAATVAVLAGGLGLRKFAGGLAAELGFGGASNRPSPDVRALGGPSVVGANQGQQRSWGFLRLLVVVLGVALLATAALKLAVRGSRFLTRDPRRLAAACRNELRDFLLDQRVDVPRSATLRELAELVESKYGVPAAGFGLHATAARFGPGRGALEAAQAMRRDLRAVRRGLRRDLTRTERVRGLLSLRSLGLSS